MPHYGSGVKKRRKRAPATAGEEGRKERREGGVKAERVGGGQRGREGAGRQGEHPNYAADEFPAQPGFGLPN